MLGVCLGSGATSTTEGPGQTEVLGVADVNADGRDEILYGGTSVSARYLEMAVWIDGALRQVTLPDGDALVLTDGVELGEERSTASAFGCHAQDGAGGGDISSVTLEERREGLTWLTGQLCAQGRQRDRGRLRVRNGARTCRCGEHAGPRPFAYCGLPCDLAVTRPIGVIGPVSRESVLLRPIGELTLAASEGPGGCTRRSGTCRRQSSRPPTTMVWNPVGIL